MYSVVANVAEYSSFVPWCISSNVLSLKPASTPSNPPSSEMLAELTIGFGSGLFSFSEKYTSQVSLVPYSSVKVRAAESPLFHHLHNFWTFEPTPDGRCSLHFSVDFAFQSSLHSSAVDLFFTNVVQKLVSAFESRCAEKYGTR